MSENDPTKTPPPEREETEPELPIAIGKPARFSRYLPKKIIEAFAKKHTLDPQGDFLVLTILSSEDEMQYALVEPIPKSMRDQQKLRPIFTGRDIRAYIAGDKKFEHLREVPYEYLKLGTIH